MKFPKKLTLFIVVAMLFVLVVPASAQLGQTDISSFTVQNVDTTDATVTVTFYDESGVAHTPTVLNSSKPNPFTLTPGESFEIYVPGIPADQLIDGRYSVVISSSAKVVAIANLVGQGNVYFNGSYSGFDAGAKDFYLPSVVFNYYGWYSLISVQNVGAGPTDVTVTITCDNGATGTITASAVPSMTSHHFVLKQDTPTGFTASTACNGSAVINSTAENVVVVDNQSVPAGGNTQSYSGVTSGATDLYVPALYHSYYGWNSSINVRKLGSGNTTVTATYSDGGTSTCNLTDAVPGCLLYMPNEHPGNGYFGATISSSGADLIAVVNAANGSQAQTYNAVGSGTDAVGVPSVMKSYYGWSTSVTCQNVGTVATKMSVEYDGYASDVYTTPDTYSAGDTVELYTPGESFLPNGYQGGATVTADAAGAEISCIVNFNNAQQMGSTVGDWSMSYNAFNK
jgi:hypothetical protein